MMDPRTPCDVEYAAADVDVLIREGFNVWISSGCVDVVQTAIEHVSQFLDAIRFLKIFGVCSVNPVGYHTMY